MMSSLSEVISDPVRLAALWRITIAQGPGRNPFDHLACTAAQTLGAPMAVVTLVEEDRQYFAGLNGMPEAWADRRELPAAWGFCPFALALHGPLMLPDVTVRPEFASNPIVRELSVSAYAGVPLLAGPARPIGTLSVLDAKARMWTGEDARTLSDLCANAVVAVSEVAST